MKRNIKMALAAVLCLILCACSVDTPQPTGTPPAEIDDLATPTPAQADMSWLDGQDYLEHTVEDALGTSVYYVDVAQDAVTIYQAQGGGEIWQRLEYEALDDLQYAKEHAEFLDMNADGYADFRLPATGDAEYKWYHCYLYDVGLDALYADATLTALLNPVFEGNAVYSDEIVEPFGVYQAMYTHMDGGLGLVSRYPRDRARMAGIIAIALYGEGVETLDMPLEEQGELIDAGQVPGEGITFAFFTLRTGDEDKGVLALNDEGEWFAAETPDDGWQTLTLKADGTVEAGEMVAGGVG